MAESAFEPQEPIEYKAAYRARAKALLGKELSLESAEKFLKSLAAIGEIEILDDERNKEGCAGSLE